MNEGMQKLGAVALGILPLAVAAWVAHRLIQSGDPGLGDLVRLPLPKSRKARRRMGGPGIALLHCLPDRDVEKPCQVFDSMTRRKIAEGMTPEEAAAKAEALGYEVRAYGLESLLEVIQPDGKELTTPDTFFFVLLPQVKDIVRMAEVIGTDSLKRAARDFAPVLRGEKSQMQCPSTLGQSMMKDLDEWLEEHTKGQDVEIAERLSNLIETRDGRDRTPDKSAVRKNGKTFRSYDVTLACPKRRPDRAPGVEPCPYCFVEAEREEANLIRRRGKKPSRCPTGLIDQLEYTNEVLGMHQPTIDKLNLGGGIRMFSYADWVDTAKNRAMTCKFLDDCKKVGLNVKVITKQPGFVRLFHDHPAIKTINLSVDLVGAGIDEETIQELRSEYPKCTIRGVALVPEDAIALRDTADVVTLFHAAGTMGTEMAKRGYETWSPRKWHADPANQGKTCCAGHKCHKCGSVGGPVCGVAAAASRMKDAREAGWRPHWKKGTCPTAKASLGYVNFVRTAPEACGTSRVDEGKPALEPIWSRRG